MDLIIEYKDLIITVVLMGAGLLRATAWGRAHAKALDLVTTAVEQNRDANVKTTVKQLRHNLTRAARTVLDDSATRADVKKASKRIGARFFKEIIRHPLG